MSNGAARGSAASLRAALVLAAALGLLVWPKFAVGSGTEFASDMVIYVIMAVGLYVQIGLLGLVNFGFSAFFGLGAYVGALYITRLSTALLPSMFTTIGVVALVAASIGAIALRATGTAFVMITLTFSQLLYVIALADDRFTNGVNGITGIRRPSLPEFFTSNLGIDLGSDAGYYYLCLLSFAVVLLLVALLQRSRLGAVFAGIRENEERMVALGYPVFAFKLLGFTLSGAIGGLAGYLNALLFGFAGPGSLFWTTSGEALLMVILGGVGSLAGPIVGAALFTWLSHYATTITDHWRLIVGVVFIAIVMFAPQGLTSLIGRRLGSRRLSGSPGLAGSTVTGSTATVPAATVPAATVPAATVPPTGGTPK